MMNSEDYIPFCKKECNLDVKYIDIIYNMHCNFCDIPYILMGEYPE